MQNYSATVGASSNDVLTRISYVNECSNLALKEKREKNHSTGFEMVIHMFKFASCCPIDLGQGCFSTRDLGHSQKAILTVISPFLDW